MQIKVTDETVMTKPAIEMLLLFESNSSFLLQELHKKQLLKRFLDSFPSNSVYNDKVRTVKYLSENQKQKA